MYVNNNVRDIYRKVWGLIYVYYMRIYTKVRENLEYLLFCRSCAYWQLLMLAKHYITTFLAFFAEEIIVQG